MAGNQRLTPHAGRIYAALRDESLSIFRRLAFSSGALATVIGFGVFGYWSLGNGTWSLFECLYMVLITITTVGYNETLPVSLTPNGRLFTLVLLVTGFGVVLYFFTTLATFILDGELGHTLWRRRMRKALDRLSDHYIICGAGETGRSVAEELLAEGRQVVVLERDAEHLDYLARRVGSDRFIGLMGDATEDELLIEAGLHRAKGIIATLHSDRDNLFVVVTARQLAGKSVRIVSRAIDDRARAKLERAGANAIVSPNHIGGRRMAHELLRPNVVGFIDLIVRDSDRTLSVEECLLPVHTPVHGRTLAKSGIRQVSQVLVLSVLLADGKRYEFNPAPDFVLESGMTLIVLGEPESIARLYAHVSGTTAPDVRFNG